MTEMRRELLRREKKRIRAIEFKIIECIDLVQNIFFVSCRPKRVFILQNLKVKFHDCYFKVEKILHGMIS